jgi:hypothetical protein
MYHRATEPHTSPIIVHDAQQSSDTSKIADLTGQATSLKSQLDAKTRELDAAQRIDMLSGQQRNLIISLVRVFNDLRDQQSELSAVANELAKEQNKQVGVNVVFYYVPICRIIVSSTKDNV